MGCSEGMCWYMVLQCVPLEHLSVGFLLGDCLFEIIICHYSFFRVYYFDVVHVLYVISDSLSCNIFYLILKAICLLLQNLKF